MQRVAGEPAHRKRGRVGTADDNRTGITQVGNYRTVMLGDQILLNSEPVAIVMSLAVDVVLDRYRAVRL